MERPIARFNERILVQKNTVSVDQNRNHKAVWNDYFSCAAYASTYQNDKEAETEVTTPQQSITFEVRWCPEISDLDSTNYRILFHDHPYDIESVDMMNYQRKIIRITARRNPR